MESKKIQKVVAESGYCSRRKAEELIKEGRVKINNRIAKIGERVKKEDKIKVEGDRINSEKKSIYILLNKPKGYSCTRKRVAGEKNIFELVDLKEHLFVAGRLDKDSHGLVLLTSDGDFAHKIMHPSFKSEKEYLVRARKDITREGEREMKKGVDIGEKEKVSVKEIKKVGNKRYNLILCSGKRRQIRRMFERFNSTVDDLQRVRIDKYNLGKLKKGEWIFIKK